MNPAGDTLRFPHLDGVRAIAALSVLVSHTSAFSAFAIANGWLGPVTARFNVGVTIFFVLSGFLLYRPFVAARLDDRDPPDIARYARRRLLRIVPAYWVALTVLAIWPGLVGVFTGEWWVYYGFLQNLKGTWAISGIGAAWSLALEVSFYIALPFIAVAVTRWLRGRPTGEQLRLEVLALGVAGVIGLLLRTWRFGSAPGGNQSTLPFFFLWFACGMILAVLSVHLARRDRDLAPPSVVALVERHPWIPWLAAAGVLVLSSRIGLPTFIGAPYSPELWVAEHLLYVTIAVLVMVPAAFGVGGGGWVRGLLAARPIAWLGTISYGIFLWHLPLAGEVAEWVNDHQTNYLFVWMTILTFVVAVIPATLSWYLVEKPLLRFKPAAPRAR